MAATHDATQFEVPARIVWLGDTPMVEMRRIEEAALAKAFWDDVVAGAPIVGILSLDEQPLPDDHRFFRGGIFHTYRCGSTLLCRQMSALPGVYAAAEPSFLGWLVLGRKQELSVLRERILKALALLVRALGKRDMVVKWPGLLADSVGDLIAAFPDVPMLFLHRDPVEVLASIELAPLGITVGAPEAVGLALPEEEKGDTAKAALLIAHLCRRLAAAPSLRRMDYAQLDTMRIARFFGLAMGDTGQEAMSAAASWHSKSEPGKVVFVSDSAARQATASPEVRRLSSLYLAPALHAATSALKEL